MSFLNKIKNNSLGITTNPFTTGRKAENTVTTTPNVNDPFMAKTASAPKLGATPTTSNKPNFLGGVAKPFSGGIPSPNKNATIPTMNKPTGVPSAPGIAPKPSPVAPSTPKTEVKTEVKNIDVSPQEMIKDMEQIEMKEAPQKEETKTDIESVEKKEVIVEEKSTKTKAKTTRKRTATKTKKTEVDEPINEELADKIEAFFKMPKTTVKYSEAVQNIKGNFIDKNWEEFRSDIIAESDSIFIESDMQEGAIKKTISKLSTLREKIWVQFMSTKHLLESISNKDAEGLIERVKFVNLEGSNETARKKSGVLAVMNYKTDEGENINLYELYDETKDRFYFLKGVMDTVKYKTDVLITMSSALKLEKGHINNH